MVKMKSISDDLEFDIAINCPEKVTKEQAYVDYMKDEESSGLMDCFCLSLLKTDLTKIKRFTK